MPCTLNLLLLHSSQTLRGPGTLDPAPDAPFRCVTLVPSFTHLTYACLAPEIMGACLLPQLHKLDPAYFHWNKSRLSCSPGEWCCGRTSQECGLLYSKHKKPGKQSTTVSGGPAFAQVTHTLACVISNHLAVPNFLGADSKRVRWKTPQSM